MPLQILLGCMRMICGKIFRDSCWDCCVVWRVVLDGTYRVVFSRGSRRVSQAQKANERHDPKSQLPAARHLVDVTYHVRVNRL